MLPDVRETAPASWRIGEEPVTQIIENSPRPAPRRVDYERMQREWPKQKAALTRALKSGSAEKVANVCIAAVKVWDEVGA